jgi:sulfide:quinone oxidoreductase
MDLASDHKITLVDRQPMFMMGLTKLWLLDGSRKSGENAGNRTQLVKFGIEFLEGEVTAIDVENREVRVGKQRLGYDYLVIALGADYSPASTLGFMKYAKNLYTESGCAEIRDVLQSLKAGTVTALVCGPPFKCPPAPYEACMIIDDMLRKKAVRGDIKLQLVTPEPHPLTILGPEAGKFMTKLLEERGIGYYPSHKVREIRRNSVLTEDGKEIQHDFVMAVPIHVAPSVLKDSGLTDESGWVPVNPTTLVTKVPNVYAVGDCAGTKIPKGLLLPRAGTLAEEQGKVVATNISREIKGEDSPASFEGIGVCYMEVGGGKAARMRANFYAQPNPTWELSPPSPETYQEKRRFLAERMEAWFP